MKIFTRSLLAITITAAACSAQAGKLGVWDSSWKQFDNPTFSSSDTTSAATDKWNAKIRAIKDSVSVGSTFSKSSYSNALNINTNDNNYIQKNQRQAYDTEYLFYKYNDTTKMLSIGLQTGYDVKNSKHVHSKSITNYAGDMKLSFGDGRSFALDFGLESRTQKNTYQGKQSQYISGSGDAGVYLVDSDGWDTRTEHNDGTVKWASHADKRTKKANLVENRVDGDFTTNKGPRFTNPIQITSSQEYSYFRIATFNVVDVLGTDFDYSKPITMTSDWTMSCYNDAIHGVVNIPVTYEKPKPVSEPASIALFGLGLFGLGLARRKNKAAAAA